MNKIQYIALLELRDITELEKDQSIYDAIEQSGGPASIEELADVNNAAMLHYMNKLIELESSNKRLKEYTERLEKRVDWLECLEAAGVDNWEGYSVAWDIKDGKL